MNKKKIICLLLVLLIVLGAIMSLGAALGRNILIEPEADEYTPGTFGGHTALYSDFSETYTSINGGNWYASDIINPYTGKVQNSYFCTNNGVNVGAVSGPDGHVYLCHKSEDVYDTTKAADNYAVLDNRVFGIYDNTVNYLDCFIVDKKAFTMDIDVTVSDTFNDHILTIRPMWRNELNKVINRDANIGFLPFRYKDGYALSAEGDNIKYCGDSFHVTVVVYCYDPESGYVACDYYVNGEFVLNTCMGIETVIPRSAVKFSGLRVGVSTDYSNTNEFDVKLDNLVINYFDKDYEGEIDELFKGRTDVDLNYNSDCVLGQRDYEIFQDNFKNKGVNSNEE